MAKAKKAATPKKFYIAVGYSNWDGKVMAAAGTTKNDAANNFEDYDGDKIEYFLELDALPSHEAQIAKVPVKKVA